MDIKIPKKGYFLLSEPFLSDPTFKRSVILLTEHNKEGSVGFILNKDTGLNINELIDDFPEFNCKVFEGGPVQRDTLHFIHKMGDIIDDCHEVCEGVYWGGNFETLKTLIQNKIIKSNDILFFLGYSGWSPRQLRNEIKENSWILTPATQKFIFSKKLNLWKDILKTLEQKYAIMANFPEDPSLN